MIPYSDRLKHICRNHFVRVEGLLKRFEEFGDDLGTLKISEDFVNTIDEILDLAKERNQ